METEPLDLCTRLDRPGTDFRHGCEVLIASTKEAAFSRLHKGWLPSAAPLCGFLCVGCGHRAYLSVETQDMCLVENQGLCLAETQDMCCVES